MLFITALSSVLECANKKFRKLSMQTQILYAFCNVATLQKAYIFWANNALVSLEMV